MNSFRLLTQDIHYYNPIHPNTREKFAARLLRFQTEEMRRQKKNELLYLCIGTDRSTGDSLGPLIGYKLSERPHAGAHVMGTLSAPVHALNLRERVASIKENHPDALVVAIDASVGNAEHVGCITLGRGPLKPGQGVKKDLTLVGDLFITGIVGCAQSADPLLLQSVRLSIVMDLADCISKSIELGLTLLEKRVENFLETPSSF